MRPTQLITFDIVCYVLPKIFLLIGKVIKERRNYWNYFASTLIRFIYGQFLNLMCSVPTSSWGSSCGPINGWTNFWSYWNTCLHVMFSIRHLILISNAGYWYHFAVGKVGKWLKLLAIVHLIFHFILYGGWRLVSKPKSLQTDEVTKADRNG